MLLFCGTIVVVLVDLVLILEQIEIVKLSSE